MKIKNNSSVTPRGLPNGQLVEPGDSVEFVGDWAAVKSHPVVSHWLETGELEIEGDEPQAAADGKAKKLPELPKP